MDLTPGWREWQRGAYFEAHEAWEDVWLALPAGDDRRRVQGLIQLAAALVKLATNARAASSLAARGLAKLDGAPDDWHGVDVAAMRARARGMLTP